MMATKPRPPASSEATETSKKPAANAEEAIQELERRLVDLGSADGEMALATADATPPLRVVPPQTSSRGTPLYQRPRPTPRRQQLRSPRLLPPLQVGARGLYW